MSWKGCGATTASGDPCRNPSGSCPHHNRVNRGGRPTKYTEEACDVVVTLGRDGASRAEMAAELDIAIKTLHNWEDAHPEFLQATTRARDLAQSWWEKQGRKGIWSRDFNASAYRLQVMNRFPADWRDKQDVDFRTPDGIQVERPELDELSVEDLKLLRQLQARAGLGEMSANGANGPNGAGGTNGSGP